MARSKAYRVMPDLVFYFKKSKFINPKVLERRVRQENREAGEEKSELAQLQLPHLH
jgi:hypothetical protein